VARGWLLASVILNLVLGVVFAAYPVIDLEVARLFFDNQKAKLLIAVTREWNSLRQFANWIPFLLVLPALFALLRKIVFPTSKMLVAPSVFVFLLGSLSWGPASSPISC
jgi:lipid A 4'-phosphatase